MLQRLQSAKSNLTMREWQEHDAKQYYLKLNIMRNASKKLSFLIKNTFLGRNEHIDYG